jgi:hypothetical protein
MTENYRTPASSEPFSGDREPGVNVQDSSNAVTIRMRPAQPQAAQSAPRDGVRIERAEDRRVQMKIGAALSPRREGILATIRTKDGSIPNPRFGLHPDMRISVPTSDGRPVSMSLRQAETEGYIRRDAQGEYHTVDQSVRQAADVQERQAAEERERAEASFPTPMSEDSDGFLSDLHAAMTSAGVSPVGSMVLAYTDRARFEKEVLPRIVANGGDSEAVMAALDASLDETLNRVGALCSAAGVSFSSFAAWCESGTIPRSRWLAAGLQALANDARPMKALVAQFKAYGGPVVLGQAVQHGDRGERE